MNLASEGSKNSNDINDDVDMENSEEIDDDISSSEESTAPQTMEQIQSNIDQPRKKPKRSWNDRYLAKFPWIHYDAEKRIAFCKFRHCNTYNSFR